MRKNFYLLAAIAAMGMMASCSNDDQVFNQADQWNAGEAVALGVNSVGVEQAITRAGISATAFAGTESLGLFIFDQSISSGAAQAADNYLKGGATTPTRNVRYQRETTGGTWAAANPIILSSTVGKVYAYYPWAEGNTNATAIPVTVAADQGTGQSDGTADAAEQADYMWATPVASKSNAAGAANHQADLTMNHALAMVSFTFQQAASAAQHYPGLGQVSSIVLKNKAGNTQHIVKTGAATMDINNGAISITRAAANDGNTVTVTPTSRTAAGSNMVQNAATVGTGAGHKMSDGTTDYTQAMQPRILVYPFEDETNGIKTGEVQVTATVDGANYTLDLPAIAPADKGWRAGYNYEYTFTLKGTGLEVTTVTITPWNLSQQNGGDISTPDNAG